MAATVTITKKATPKGARFHCGFIQADNSYPTGGYAITANQLGFNSIDQMTFGAATNTLASGTLGFVANYNFVTSKVQFYWVDTTVDGAGMAEVVNGTNISTIFAPWQAFGS